MPAFQAAVDAGLPIELDVQLTADDHLVAHHDDDLSRTSGLAKPIRSLPLAEVTARDLFGSGHTVPDFAAVLDLVAGRVPILVEVKPGADRDRRAEVTARYLAGYDGPVAVQSFDPLIVAWFRKHAPHLVRGQLSGRLDNDGLSAVRRTAQRNLLLNVLSRPHFVAYELDGLSPRRASWIRKRYPLLAWTVRTEEQRDRARELVDNFIFEKVSIG